jgi:hypothetical protein
MARELALQLAEESGVEAAFLAGSLTAGLGNETSDVDIYLVGPALSARRRQLAVDRTRMDVLYVPHGDLAALVDRLAGSVFEVTAPPVPDRDVALGVRLCGAEVVSGAEVLAPLRDRLAASAGVLRRLAIDRWLTAAHFEFEDFTGLRPGDADAALMVGRAMLVSAGKAVAACGGDLYMGHKWVWRQLDRSGPAGFPLSHFTATVRADLDEPGVSRLVAFTQTCLIAAATLGWQDIGLAQWPRWRTADGPLRRAPGFLPRAYTDCVVLTSPGDRRVQLRHEVALVWGLSDGVAEQEVVAAAQRLRTGVYEELTPQRCHEIIGSLIDAGLMGRHADHV